MKFIIYFISAPQSKYLATPLVLNISSHVNNLFVQHLFKKILFRLNRFINVNFVITFVIIEEIHGINQNINEIKLESKQVIADIMLG